MRKVYFAGSIRGGRDDAAIYKTLIDYLISLSGWSVLTEHIGLKSLKATGEEGSTAQYVYERDMNWIEEADAVIAEATTPSLGVGYEIARAEVLGKPILCLFRPKPGHRLSTMIACSPGVLVQEYSDTNEAEAAMVAFLAKHGTA